LSCIKRGSNCVWKTRKKEGDLHTLLEESGGRAKLKPMERVKIEVHEEKRKKVRKENRKTDEIKRQRKPCHDELDHGGMSHRPRET
jgi:hypothetical protein